LLTDARTSFRAEVKMTEESWVTDMPKFRNGEVRALVVHLRIERVG
jgi:hypothetical protein